jgi:uncharacterized protein YggE
MLVRVVPAFGALVALLPAASLIAQPGQSSPQQPPPPYIAASAIGETHVTPDRVPVQVTVDSRRESAASAAAENRTRQEQVIAAVKATGVASPQIRTAGYRVNPEYAERPERGKAPKVTGYRANNTVQVEVRSIENIGRVIDTALGAGARTSARWDSTRRARTRRVVRRFGSRSRRHAARPSRRPLRREAR